MRLLIATPLYPPEPGGPATYVRLLETGLPTYGCDVSIVKFSDVRKYPKLFRHLLYFLKVYRASKKADMILALDPVSTGLPAQFAARLLHKPFLIKIVGDYAWEQGQQRFGITDSLDEFLLRKNVPLSVRVLEKIQTYVASKATTVIVPSEYLRRVVASWGIADTSITVIHNSITLENGGSIPDSVKRIAHPYVITVGRLVPWKHVDSVIEAIGQIPGASLVVVGDGPERNNLEKAVSVHAPSAVIFTGALSHPDTLATIAAADILVLNSSYEGLSHLLIEALMLGKAIVATDCGGNGELITHEENGLLIPVHNTQLLKESITTLIESPERRSRLSAKALSSSEKFSLATMLKSTHELLQHV